MGFNKIFLPDAKELRKRYRDDPESIIRWLGKADAIIGPEDSVRYAEKVLKPKKRNK